LLYWTFLTGMAMAVDLACGFIYVTNQRKRLGITQSPTPMSIDLVQDPEQTSEISSLIPGHGSLPVRDHDISESLKHGHGDE